MAREFESRAGFLGLDHEADADARRRHVMAGGVLIGRLITRGADGADLAVPSAAVHHWRGAVFIPGTTVTELLAGVRRSAPGAGHQDVLESRILERGRDRLRVFLRLQRRKFVTVVYNTEHDVRFETVGAGRAMTTSTATRIAEVERHGEPGERELTPGEDRGFLWRLNAPVTAGRTSP
jgi:hypothetical protein